MTRLLVAAVVLALAPGATRTGADPSAGLWLYSDVVFNTLEGEYNGLQVALIPYSGKIDVLWRSATGSFNEPLLLNAKVHGHTLAVTVPPSDQFSGDWNLLVKDREIDASGPRGLRFELKAMLGGHTTR